MRTKLRIFLLLAILWVAILAPVRSDAQDGTYATILSIHYENGRLVVIGEVPPGFKKVTLESKLRVERRSWEPRAVKRIEPVGGEVEFQIPYNESLELLRLRVDTTDSLPSTFFTGTTTFNSATASPGSTSGSTGGTTGTGSGGTTSGAVNFDNLNNSTGGALLPVLSRTVKESDIWKVQGDRLYFFNQSRGLQVIDISSPAEPELRGTLSLPASGEQMYILDNEYVVLLARLSGCYDAKGRVLLVNAAPASPVLQKEFVLNGSIVESRLVGQILYLVSKEYRPLATDTNQWEAKTLLRSFDLRNPEQVPAPQELWIETDINVVAATDRYILLAGTEILETQVQQQNVWNAVLQVNITTGPFQGSSYTLSLRTDGTFVITSGTTGAGTYTYNSDGSLYMSYSDPPEAAADGDADDLKLTFTSGSFGTLTGRMRTGGQWHPDVQGSFSLIGGSVSTEQPRISPVLLYVDISSSSGEMYLTGKVQTAGALQDKFKVNLSGDVLTTISRPAIWGGPSVVETFSLVNPQSPTKLGSLAFANNEQLYATRFAGNKLYVVTFLRTDPLWVIDLDNPAQPTIRGELQIPGWSTYIQPLPAGRLLTIGIGDNWGSQLAVQLFDVNDPATPRLLDKELLGERYSSGEVTTDEKAFGFIPAANLALVPFVGEGWQSQVQLVEIGETNLTLRGKIEHNFTARRATLVQDHVLSISERELISVDASDRDHPTVRATLSLSWSVDQVYPKGDYLVELESAPALWAQQSPVLRVVSTAAPERVIETLALTNLPVALAIEHENRLHIAQFWPGSAEWPLVSQWTGSNYVTLTNPPTFFLTTLDLSSLPGLNVLTQKSFALPRFWRGTRFQALLPSQDSLVIAADSGGGVIYGTTGGVGGGTTGGWIDFLPVVTSDATGTTSGSGAGSTTGGFTPLASAGAPITIGPVWIGGGISYVIDQGFLSNQRRFVAFDLQSGTPELQSDITFKKENAFALSPVFASSNQLYFSFLARRSEIAGISTNVYNHFDLIYETNLTLVTNILSIPDTRLVTNLVEKTSYSWETNFVGATNVALQDFTRRIYRQQISPSLRQISTRGGHVLGLTVENQASNWGDNSHLQLGHDLSPFSPEPILRSELPPLLAVSAGRWHSAALDHLGRVWAWGANYYWQLGIEDSLQEIPLPPGDRSTPVVVAGLPKVITLSAGGAFNLALAETGEIWAWGENVYGQLGNGSSISRAVPQLVGGLGNIRHIAAGYFHALAADDSGQLWGWGDNSRGQLTASEKAFYEQPQLLRSALDLKGLSAGRTHSLALGSDGAVLFWGAANYSTMLAPTAPSQWMALTVSGIPPAKAVAAGGSHSVVLSEDGSVWTWGLNHVGQLGLSSPDDSALPRQVPGLSNIVSIAAGGLSTFALSEDGALYSWGDNSHGQLGMGEAFDLVTPVAVTNFVANPVITTFTNTWLETNIFYHTTYLKGTNTATMTNIVSRWISTPVTNYTSIYRYFEDRMLQVLDIEDPGYPSLRRPIKIPAPLIGISHQGQVIYTVGPAYDANGLASEAHYLSALAYDGVEVYMLDSKPTSSRGQNQLVQNEAAYLARHEPTNTVLECYLLDVEGKLQLLELLPLPEVGLQVSSLGTGLIAANGGRAYLIDTFPTLRSWAKVTGPECLPLQFFEMKEDERGLLWLPLGPYGLLPLPMANP